MRHFMTHAHDCLIASESDARDHRLAGKETLGPVKKCLDPTVTNR